MGALDEFLSSSQPETKDKAFKIAPEVQQKRDQGRMQILQAELTQNTTDLNSPDTDTRRRAQANIQMLQREMGGSKQPSKPAQTGSLLDDFLSQSQEQGPAIKVQIAGTVKEEPKQIPQMPATPMPQEPSTIEKIGRSAAGLADTVIGGIQALPGAALAETGYAGVRALEGLGLAEPGRAERGREAVYKEFVEPYTQPVGQTTGVAQTPEYKGEASQQAMQFIGENLDKGADWISAKTGIPKADVQNMMNTLLVAAPAATKSVKNVLKEQFAAKAPVAPKVEPTMAEKPRVTYAELQEQLQRKKGKPFEMPGVGAAEVTAENQRIARAKELPVPIELSKDQATRNPADVRFARETAKDPVLGQALQEKYANDNLKIQKNLDNLVEQTGAEFTGLPEAELSQKLIDTVEPYRKQRKQEVTSAYQAADQAGETNQLVSYKPLVDYIENQTKNRPTKKGQNPILGIVEEELKANDPSGTGQINLKAMDDIYKTIVNETDPTQKGSLYHSGNLKKAFNKATEGAGGDFYRQARKLNAEYMTEFIDTPVIKNLTAIKKGTTQRLVAIENLIDKSIIKGTTDDVRRLFATLEKTPEGKTIANELRGYVAQHIKNEATKGVQLDINGLPYVSTKNLDTVIKGLDKSGKLEYLFGKKNAEYYRTLNDATKDIQTVPQGTTNPSGTGAQIATLLAESGAQFALSGVPVPIAGGIKLGYGQLKTRQQLRKIKDFVDYSKGK
jgi:hypothetical protein